MDFKTVDSMPDLDKIMEKLEESDIQLPIQFVTELMFESVKHLVYENRTKFHLNKIDAMNLTMSLLVSMSVTMLVHNIADDDEESLKKLAEECKIPMESFIKKTSKKGYDA